MKKVIASAAGILFAVFGIAILGLLISLTFSALGKLFPDNFTNQLWGACPVRYCGDDLGTCLRVQI